MGRPRLPSDDASGGGTGPGIGDEGLFRSIFEEASDAILVADDQSRYVLANRAAAELLGVAAGAIIGRRVAEFTPQSLDPEADWAAFLARGRMSGEYQVARPDGSVRDVEFSAVAHIRPGLHLSILRDVTDRKEAERTLRRTEARLRALFDSDIVNITFGNRRGEIIEANDAFLRMVGRSREELRAGLLTWQALTPPEFLDVNNRAQEDLRERGTALPFEKQYLTPDGRRPWVLLGLASLPGTEDGTVALSIDITRQKEAERALVESERKFSAIFASSPHGIFIGEVESCRIIETNPAFQELIGRCRKDTIGRIPPDLGFEVSRGLRQEVIARLRAGEVIRNLEVDVTRKPGDVRRVMMAFDSLVLEGAPRLFLAVVADVTERHHLEAQLRQAQKMEAIGRLAGGIAHDFNNLLTAIIGYAELLHHSASLPGELRADVEEILKAGRSAAGLTGQLLTFSRRQVTQPRMLSLNDTVRHIESILRRVLGEDVLLTTRLASPLAPVFSDPVQIEQVLMNLAVNARDAMPGGGHMTIETANVLLDDVHATTHRGASAGPHVMLAVSDTGTGMDEAVKSRLFEPFFTTKEPGKGTGLGLATVYGAIRQMGGSILVESAPGHGTTFRIYLPVAEGAAAEEVRHAAPGSLAGTETILLVEDQEEVRRVAAQILTRHGYGVIEASGPREALRLAASAGTRFHLLLTDVVMPELSGPELARQVKVLRPDLRVLYTSGYTDDAIGHHGVLESDIAFAPKPFTPHALLQKVREVLDAPMAPRI